MARIRRLLLGSAAALFIGYLALLIPESAPPASPATTRKPFAWNQDVLWSSLEAQFKAVRASDCASLAGPIDASLAQLGGQLDALPVTSLEPADARLDSLETNLFHLAPRIAACPDPAGMHEAQLAWNWFSA